MTEIAIAYDVPELAAAVALDERLGPGPEIAKIGLELFAAEGPEAVRALTARGRRVFLDLKLHDIPNTVRGAARSAARLGAELLTVHAFGGGTMIAAAVAGAREGSRERPGPETRIVAVTLLTSLDVRDLPPGFERPFVADLVLPPSSSSRKRSARSASPCAAPTFRGLRAQLRRPFYAVTPGIRPAGGERNDQARVATITEAVRLGSNLLVLGRDRDRMVLPRLWPPLAGATPRSNRPRRPREPTVVWNSNPFSRLTVRLWEAYRCGNERGRRA
jgi:orotidine-5'-phosphate decarboxylase